MVISKAQGDLFYKLWLPLLSYANYKYRIVKDFAAYAPSKGISPEKASRVANRIWEDVSIIDEYLEIWSGDMNEEEIDIVAGWKIRSVTVSIKAGRYYVSVLVKIPDNQIADNDNNGIGIDLGLKDLAVVSNGKTYKNINKSAKVKKLEKQLRREQKCLSRKYENLKKGKSAQKNIQKQKLKVQKLHHKINNIRTDHINKTIAEIVKTKPSYITIEDLNVSGMMKNSHLSKAVASQKFYEFRTKLKTKCDDNGIELRVVNRFYPSSRMCHNCGCIKKDLKLSDRIYRCACGYVEDRDFNASLNLRDAKTYEVA